MADAASMNRIDIGSVLADTYEVTALLGKGGMGAVFSASHLRLPGKRVAIKVLHTEVAADQESLTRFRREAEIASRLGHPHIVEVHDFNTLADGTPYLVLEHLDGESLAERLARGPLSLETTRALIRQIGSALQAAHREGIIHRDLKPANIFLCPSEIEGLAAETAKVLDFGISKIRGSQTLKTQDSTILGTPQYMAPEQATGNHDAVDARTDVFALGAMVYEMLAGRPAFSGNNIPEVVFKVVYEQPPPLAQAAPSVPAAVAAAVHQALEKKQEERFADVSAFVEALTGSPLTSARRGAVITPAGAGAPVAPSEALDATMASGNHPPVAVAATMASGSHSAEAVAATMASGNHPAPQAAYPEHPQATRSELEGQPPPRIAGPADTGAAHQPRRWRPLPWVLGTAGVLVVFSLVALLATHRDRDADPGAGALAAAADTPALVDLTADAGATVLADAAPRVAVTADAALAASPADAAPRRSPPPRVERERPEPAEPAGDPEALRDLADGEAALRGGDVDRAIFLARRSLRQQQGGAGYALLARAHCTRQDLGNALAAFRNVPRPLRRAVVRYCANHGVELGR